ncbi:hypothetical protein [Bradyrhizobium sp. Leo121]|uniref:hypothetical protein n=1 Tax=Bradyrhizobium sp. Leo121 TaxID=1571195 RepID=UPI0010294B8D|nr:hypothetical protein [Bradyrhizobium sp. Leo121]
MRISSVDGVDIGWRIQDSLAFAIELEKIGIDRIDCSSGDMKLLRGRSMVWRASGFNVANAARILCEEESPSIAVGLIREPEYVESTLRDGKATMIALGREGRWPVQAALSTGLRSRVGRPPRPVW